jgi:hypothetical protein
MANRIPLIVDSSTKQVKELPTSDNLDLSSSGIVGVTSIGINTTSSSNPLQVNNGSSIVIVDSQGDIGIGTTNATSKLYVTGHARITGVVTATSYYGDGSNLSNIVSGVGIKTAGGLVGTGVTIIDFRGAGISTVTVGSGIGTVNITGGSASSQTSKINIVSYILSI